MSERNRVYELDWLRVLLIFAVFMHHVLMPFNGDDWHIMNTESSKFLDDIMVYFEQFRLPSLFFIAGAGSYLLLSKVAAKKFLKDKFFRLLIPFVVGMVLIVPPQTYFEDPNAFDSFWQAFPAMAFRFEPNHLWFIEFLVVFSLLALPLFKLTQSDFFDKSFRRFESFSMRPLGLFSWVFSLIALRVLLKWFIDDDGHSVTNLSLSLFYLWFFVSGMWMIKSSKIWAKLLSHRKPHLICLVVSTLLFYGYYYSPDLSPYLSLNMRWAIWWMVCSLVAWSALLTLLGYGQKYFYSRPRWLKLTNELIYPFYIFHQTVIVVIGYFVIQLSWPLSLKAVLLLCSTFTVTAGLCLLLVYPFNWMRYLFGLKKKRDSGGAIT